MKRVAMPKRRGRPPKVASAPKRGRPPKVTAAGTASTATPHRAVAASTAAHRAGAASTATPHRASAASTATPHRAVAGGDEEPRTRIIVATIEVIERLGIDGASIREIAREAGMNSASISYYFSSKEKLVELALERALEEGFANGLRDLDLHVANGRPFRDAVEDIVEALILGALRYPRITYAQLRAALIDQRYDTIQIQRLQEFIRGLAHRIDPNAMEKSGPAIVSSMVLIAGLLPKVFEVSAELSLDDPTVRRAFVHRICSVLFY